MQPSVRAAWRPFNTTFEGLTYWMYADVKQLVTTGMGNLIDPIALALPLPWLRNADNQPASQAEITGEWNAVKNNLALAQAKPEVAENLATLHLTDVAVDQLIQAALTEAETELLSIPAFAGFAAWPADAQLGLLSMAWALGAAKLKTAFPHFSAACQAQDFVTAAGECEINTAGNPGVIPRNTANQQAFQFAAQQLAASNFTDLLTPIPGAAPLVA